MDSNSYTLSLNNKLSVRMYTDTRPRYLETASIQKGLVLVLDGKELNEEGVGFGLPIVKYSDKTFFSRQAKVSFKQTNNCYIFTKTYTLDTISLKKFGKSTYIDDNLYSLLQHAFDRLYLRYKKFWALFNKLMELRQLAAIKTEFVAVKPRGEVTVIYECTPTRITVKADFSKISLLKCNEVLVLNEQGSNIFSKYTDTSGLTLLSDKIGAWDIVTAQKATLHNPDISFTMQSSSKAKLVRGWENTRNRFSWTGLSYSMHPHNGIFEYSICIDFNG